MTLRLQSNSDLEVVGECSNGRDAVQFITSNKPDLVFLDIQMPVMNGIEVMRALNPEVLPFVIFLTAFDQYVMRAFEVHAIDYLLKPVDDARFNASLNHARRILGAQQAAAYSRRLQAVLDRKPAPEPFRRIAVRVGKLVRFVSVDDIDWIEAQGDYAEIHVGTRSHLIREPLNTLTERLNPEDFLRIHRSAIVRLNRIAGVNSLPNRDCTVTLHNGTSLRVSRSYSDHLRKLLRNQL
ncbi:LytTR family DNA-binding domain-containing protein [Occallatibacter riparius]|uniref:LytTR family DNA-binding domain-containing protein n=1 Tax=Occallatibacter riparius TaxID=1002689 RepID=A0A9J7BK40_9BACT|nr:LytTR family DNA-binding domain-containing protein [Occallatibacter riparius]